MNTNFENKITYNQILFRHARGKSIMEGMEIHPYHEILYFIGGGGRFLTESFEVSLHDHTILMIPKNMYHRFMIADAGNYTRLVLNFPDVGEFTDIPLFTDSEIKVFSPSASVTFLLEKMCTALGSNPETRENTTLLYGAFLMLLSELSRDAQKSISPRQNEDRERITKCLEYVSQNFTKPLSVESIAKEMNISPSTLAQCFKKHLGISIYKYITEKRLIYAHSLLCQNANPTKIYLDCGYNDYATFYKAYLKMFGHPPSKDK